MSDMAKETPLECGFRFPSPSVTHEHVCIERKGHTVTAGVMDWETPHRCACGYVRDSHVGETGPDQSECGCSHRVVADLEAERNALAKRCEEQEAEIKSLSKHLNLALPQAAKACVIEAQNTKLTEALEWIATVNLGIQLNRLDVKTLVSLIFELRAKAKSVTDNLIL